MILRMPEVKVCTLRFKVIQRLFHGDAKELNSSTVIHMDVPCVASRILLYRISLVAILTSTV